MRLWNQVGKAGLYVAGHRGPGTNKVKTPGQFIGNELIVGRALKWNKVGQELSHVHGPRPAMITTRRSSPKPGTVPQPGASQFIKTTLAHSQAKSGCGRIQMGAVEIIQNLSDELRR